MTIRHTRGWCLEVIRVFTHPVRKYCSQDTYLRESAYTLIYLMCYSVIYYNS